MFWRSFDRVRSVLGPQNRVVRHMKALSHPDLARQGIHGPVGGVRVGGGDGVPDRQPVHQRMRSVFGWAVAMEYRTDNLCDRVRSVLGPQNRVVRHMKALSHREVGSAIRKARKTDGMPVAKLAFEFLVLAAVRWREVRWAEWSEIDRSGGVWTVPATRMKAKREHRVPLCRRALEILDEARALGGEG